MLQIYKLLEKSSSFRPGVAIIEEKVENGDVEFTSDQDILLQILLNVGLNALDALGEKGGRITFQAKREGDDVKIEVKDTGEGMDSSSLTQALEPFYTTKPHGTGLGLAVCAQSVLRLQGNINLDSALGMGTTVSLRLPYEPRVWKQNHGH